TTGDGVLDDVVLERFDATTGVRTPICPSALAAVAAGATAFLRPERSGPTPNLPACPAGPDLNGDGDTADEVVHFAPRSGPIVNLGVAASDLSISAMCT